MKNKFLLFILCTAYSGEAYICHAVIMRKFLPDLNRYHYVIGLGDFHDTIVPEDQAHRDAVEAWLKQPHNKGMRVITEDLNAPSVEGRCGMKGYSLLRPIGAFLGGITEISRSAGAVVANLEYRYGRLIAFGPMRHSLKNLSTVAASETITVGDLIQEVEDELAHIARFSDGHLLNAWYATEVAKIRSAMQSFKWHTYADKTVAEYVASLHRPLRSYIDKHLLIFDRAIFDMKIVHDIVAHPNAERTCIIAGGSHIDRAEVQLNQIGYEVVFRIDPSCSLFSGLGAFFLGESMPTPYPIEKSKLTAFLNKLPA